MAIFGSFLLLFLMVPYTAFGQTETHLEVFGEHIYFPKKTSSSVEHHQSSLGMMPEVRYETDQGRQVWQFKGFYRFDGEDEERTHGDVREASFINAWSQLELRIGVSQIFWGITESQHLVDSINQIDLVEDPRGEKKLGQPMASLSYMSDYGTVTGFVLPYFRERTFPGTKARFQSLPPVDARLTTWEDKAEEKHIDYAIRYAHTILDFDFGLSWFKGTDRVPRFLPHIGGLGSVSLAPQYVQIEKWGLELQYAWRDILFKLEAIDQKRTQVSDDPMDHQAMTVGLEFTWAQVISGVDLGLLLEYLYDDREDVSLGAFDNHIFPAMRVALNHQDGGEFLIGAILSCSTGQMETGRIEASSRIGDQWKASLQVNVLQNLEDGHPLNRMKDDDAFKLRLSYFL